MKHTTGKLIAAGLLTAVVLGLFTSCSGGSQNSQSDNSTVSGSESSVSSGKSSVSSDSSSDSSPVESRKEDGKESSQEKSQSDNSDQTDEKEKGDIPPLDDPDPSDVGYVNENGILIYQKTAYETFYGYDGIAKEYAAAISGIKKALGNDITVYNVVVPTHCGITLPDRFFDEYGITDQNQYINTITSSYDADVIGINTYQTLMHHRDEYLYFHTDHHWTGLAAYYAYKDFCKTAGVDYWKLTDLEEKTIPGYYGCLTNYADASLLEEDTVHYFTKDIDATTTIYENDGTGEQTSFMIHDYAEGANAYGVFLGGDRALMVCKNKDGNGKKIAVVKESYGNAFAPFIAYTYSETHMIDFRYIEFDFVKYIKDNGITDVIFVNNTMASATPMRIDELNGLVSSSASSEENADANEQNDTDSDSDTDTDTNTDTDNNTDEDADNDANEE